MELFAVVVFLLYASQDSLTVTVEVYKGAQSVVLPCQYSKELLELVTVKWSRFDLDPSIVHLRQEGDDKLAQNQLFRERTSLRLDAQDFGDFSLTLKEPQLSDSGIYICSLDQEMLSDVQLHVREIFPTWAIVLLVLLVLLAVSGGLLFHFRLYFMSGYKVEVDPGVESVLLPFKTTVRLPEDVTVKWRNKTGWMVHSNDTSLEELQHRLYRNRTKMKEELKSGDFSLTLKNPTDRDTDIYTCTVYKRSSDEILTKKQVLLNVKAGADSFIIAIDFGSGYSGYAFNVRPREEGGGTQLKRWGEELGLDSPKTPTCILFDKDEEFLKFGYEAKTAYNKMRGFEAWKHYFFEDFKRRIRRLDNWGERIYAANYNNSMKALDAFREVLMFLKDDALKTINVHPAGGKFTASDFTWVLTVPADWKDFAKEFMIEAAIQAGLVTEDTKDKLMLVLEPEAALTWCLKLPSDGFFTQNHSRDSQDPSPGPTDAGTSCNDPPGSQEAVHFEKEPEETKVLLETQNRDGKRYLVVDCGDKTIDFTVLEVLEGGTLKKLQASINYLGGRTVDWKFKQFLGEIFSDGVWKEYEENFPSEVQKMMYDFIRLKQVDEDVQISCPDNLREQAQRKKKIETFFDSVEGASWDEGVIRISREKLRSFFDESLQGITKSLREELQKDLNIGSIVLVGGFAESQILRQHITDQFGPQYKVLCPLRPQEAVLKGAVELGRNPKLVSSQKKGPACLNWFS